MRTHTDREVRILVARSSVGAHHVPLNLAHAQLEMANLPHVDLRGANLAGVNLRGAMLWGARLDGACLDGADLSCANLTWGSLVGCSMNGTLLVEADLDETLVDGGLWDTVTVGAEMVTITPTGEDWGLSAQDWSHSTPPRLMPEEMIRIKAAAEARDAVILREHRQRATPAMRRRGASGFSRKFEELELAQARVLSDHDIQGLLHFSAATGKPLNLRGCNLSGANLRNAVLRGACLSFTDATGAEKRGVDLIGADLEHADGW